MACDMQCATSKNYDSAWEFYGPNWSALGSHYFEVGADPIILTVVGLEEGQCIQFEQVFGCGSGDTFVPYVVGCCPLTVCLPTTSVVISQSGRYRMVLDGEPVPDPSLITVYGRPQRVPPGYGGLSMAQCCTPSHVPAVISSVDGVVLVTASGTDNQTFTLDFQPVPAADELVSNTTSLGILCTALTPCVQSLIPPVPVPVTVVGGDAVTQVSAGPNYVVSFNPVAGATELTTDPTALGILCTALTPCMTALIPPVSGAGYPNVTSPTSTVVIGGSGTANLTLDVDPVSTAVAIAASVPAVNILCSALTPCFLAALPPPASVTTDSPHMSVSFAGNTYTIHSPIATVGGLLRTGIETTEVVTAGVFRAALYSSLDRPISIVAPSTSAARLVTTSSTVDDTLYVERQGTLDGLAAVRGNQLSSGLGSAGVVGRYGGGGLSGDGVIGVHQASNLASQGNGVTGITYTPANSNAVYGVVLAAGGNGSAVVGAHEGSGTGHGVLGYAGDPVGGAPSAVSTGYAGLFVSGPRGTRVAALRATAMAANTTYAAAFDGSVLSSGGYITSDERLKENIKAVDIDAAVRVFREVDFLEFDKRSDVTFLASMLKERADSAAQWLKEAKPPVVDAVELARQVDAEIAEGRTDSEDRSKRRAELVAKAEDNAKKFDAAKANAEAVVSQASMDLAAIAPRVHQAGVIAQRLSALLASIGDFGWLVQKNGDFLVVDYDSLQVIWNIGAREVIKRLTDALASGAKRIK